MKNIAIFFISLSLFLGIHNQSVAQATLPEIDIITKDGINILSWNNPYTSGIKTIIIERSNDSILSFINIGVVKNFTTTTQSYVDATPLLGDNWYRVNVVFTSDMEWRSNVKKIVVDSAAIANRKPITNTDTLQKIVTKAIEQNKPIDEKIVSNSVQTITYPKSKYIFTNPFSGNVSIELKDFDDNDYHIEFLTLEDKSIFKIPRINEGEIILDKRNFQKLGTYKFIIYKNDNVFEKGFISIF